MKPAAPTVVAIGRGATVDAGVRVRGASVLSFRKGRHALSRRKIRIEDRDIAGLIGRRDVILREEYRRVSVRPKLRPRRAFESVDFPITAVEHCAEILVTAGRDA